MSPIEHVATSVFVSEMDHVELNEFFQGTHDLGSDSSSFHCGKVFDHFRFHIPDRGYVVEQGVNEFGKRRRGKRDR